MVRISRNCLVGILMGLALTTAAQQAQGLEIGDPAPELQISTWVKGDPVKLADGRGKNLYVLEFWATWCTPCLETIPDLTELQKEYRSKGVVIVGISDEPASTVRPFVERMGDKMDFTVAADRREATTRAYLGGFGIQSIPHTFVIDKNGVIAWHGHPYGGLEIVLERMVAGKYDIELAKQEAVAARMMDDYFQLVDQWNLSQNAEERTRIAERARRIGNTLLERAARSPHILDEFASAIVLVPGSEYRDLELAARAAEAAFKAGEQSPADEARKFMHDYFRTLRTANPRAELTAEQKAKLSELEVQILKQAGPEELTAFAWTIMAAPDLEPRDLQLAVKAADAARTKTNEQDATALDTYARALFETGQRAKALEYARKAVQVNKDERLDAMLRQTLQEYERAVARPVQAQPTTK